MEQDFGSQFEQKFLTLDRIGAEQLFESMIGTYTPMQVIERYLVPAMEKIGEGWENGTLALSQIYMSGRICEELVDKHLPPKSPNRKNQPNMAIAVFDDYHEIGKRIVYSYLRASGYELADYGRVAEQELIELVDSDGIEILLLSVLMLPSALRLKEVIQNINEKNNGTKIIVGGAPFRFDRNLWKEIGAFGMGEKAGDVLHILAEIDKGRPE